MKDTFGLIPADIRARYEKEEWVERATGQGRALARALKDRYGEEMSVVFVRERAKDDPHLPAECIPGRWHVVRYSPPPGKPDYWPILGPGGRYRDPDSGVMNELAEIDLRRPEVMERMLERSRVDSPHKRHERELRTEQRRDELRANFRAAKRVPGEGGLKKSMAKKRGLAIAKPKLILP